MTTDPMRLTSLIMNEEQWLIWKDKLFKVLGDQGISTGPQRYSLTERLLTGDMKAIFNQALHWILAFL